ncbi:MAG: hypothetical protein JOY79_01855, partial [Acidobacteriaceae bacterium]|nr:hypothetical protein [Acidobacteriaceae bacterium]
MRKSVVLSVALVAALSISFVAAAVDAPITHPPTLGSSVRAHMRVLAGPALRGRGSATEDEHAAANYVAGQLKQYGIEPAASANDYVQQIAVEADEVISAPVLQFRHGGRDVHWRYGVEFSACRLAAAHISGPLVKIDATTPEKPIEPGAVVYLDGAANPWKLSDDLISKGAALVTLERASAGAQISKVLPRIPNRLADRAIGELESPGTKLILTEEAAATISSLPAGTVISLDTPVRTAKRFTWNALGKLT